MSSDPDGISLIKPKRKGFILLESNNWYSYVNNNPVKYIDPTGLNSYICIWNSSTDNGGAEGHAGIAIQNYVDYRGYKIPTGTYTYYDLWPKDGVNPYDLANGVPSDYNKRTIYSLKDIIDSDPSASGKPDHISVNGEGRAPDSVIRIVTSFEQDQKMKDKANELFNLGADYIAIDNNCSTNVQKILKTIFPFFDASQEIEGKGLLSLYGKRTTVAPNNLQNAVSDLDNSSALKGDKKVEALPFNEYFGK